MGETQLLLQKVFPVYLITFVVILPALYYDNKFSVYSQLQRRDAIDIVTDTIKTREEAAKYASSYFKNSPRRSDTVSTKRNRETPYIAIGVVTVKRGIDKETQYQPRYILEVVARVKMLLDKLDSEGQPKISFSICNLEYNYDAYEDIVFLSQYVHVINIYANTTRAKQNKAESDRYQKEKQDYGLCLREIMKFNAKYTLIMEDDALLRLDFFEILHHILETHVENKYVRGELVRVNSENLASMKFYFPKEWQGYGWDLRQVSDLVAFGCVGGGIIVNIAQWQNRNRLRGHKYRVALFMVGVIYWILLAEFIGRQNLRQLRSISPQLYYTQKAPGCCTQAVLYNQRHVGKLVKYLLSPDTKCSKKFPMDIAISKNFKKQNLESLIVLPNLLEHIGVVSSLPKVPRIET